MSIRFAIRCTEAPASKEGNDIVRFSGTSEPFIEFQRELQIKKLEKTKKGIQF